MMACIFTNQLIYILSIQFYLVILILFFKLFMFLRKLYTSVKVFNDHFILFRCQKNFLMLLYLKGTLRKSISLFDGILKLHPVDFFIVFGSQIYKIISIRKITFDFCLIQEGTELNQHHTVKVILKTRCDKGWIWELKVH